MKKGALTSLSAGDLPEYRAEDNWAKGGNVVEPDFSDDHWTDQTFGSSASRGTGGKDLFDDEPLPEPDQKAGRSFSLFGKKGPLRPSKYDPVLDNSAPSPLDEELAETAFSSENARRRERSTSLGGRLKTAFSVFSSKYEAFTRPSVDGVLKSDSDAPVQTDEETRFRGVHYSKQERGSKLHDEHTVAASFTFKGVYLEEQPSGDYVDDISPAVVTKYFVDPKVGSFNLVVSRKSRYSASTQVEYTVSLTSKHYDMMMACWKDITNSIRPLSPRLADAPSPSGKGIETTTTTTTKKKKTKKEGSSPDTLNGDAPQGGSPSSPRSKKSSATKTTTTTTTTSPPKKDLLLDL